MGERHLNSALAEFSDLEVVGTGAGSTIFRGTSQADGRTYAIKVVKHTREGDERFIKQAQNEFRIASILEHDNIIKVFCDRRRRKWFRTLEYDIVMEYFGGRMLCDRADLSMPDLIAVFWQVARAVEYMHRMGFVHTDIKPENILVDERANVKVIDFGVACKRNETKDRVQGTPEFMAPEQVSKKPLDERTDIYNLGATMYKVLTGQVSPENASIVAPLSGKDVSLVKKDMRYHNALIPESLCHVVEKCCRRSRSRRYQRMGEVVAALTAALREVAPPGYGFLERVSA